MIQPTAFWLFPLILLPGVALIVMSTSARYAQIHEELHHIIEGQENISQIFLVHLKTRATYFRNALVALYVSVGLFAVGSIAGALMDFLNGPSTVTVVILTCLGILCFIYASIELIRESVLSLRVIEHHLEDIMVVEEESSGSEL
jgi:hypothetical protein